MRTPARSRAAGAAVVLLAALSTLSTAVDPAHAATESASLRPAARTQAAQGVVLSGWGDSAGYHVAVGAGTGSYQWHQVVIIDPDGIDDWSWTGYQCLSGGGEYAAVVILPASAADTPAWREHGAFAYSVSLRTGVAHPIATGVLSAYFDPGCGTGNDAAFTAALGPGEQATEVIRASLVTGQVEQQVRVGAQFTSAVPTATGITGVIGSSLVTISPPAAGEVQARRQVATPGLPYDLHPAVDGVIDFLTTNLGPGSTAWQDNQGMLSELGRGPRDGTQLYQGRAGVVLETGLTAMTAGGSTALRVTSPAAVRAMTISGAGTIAAAGASTQRVTTPPGFVPVGVTSPVVQVPVAGRGRKPSPGTARPAGAPAPACAVPRLDSRVQVLQLATIEHLPATAEIHRSFSRTVVSPG